MKVKLNKLDFIKDELLELIEEVFEVYIDECDLDEDRGVDSQDFASHAKEIIEHNNGIFKFSDFNIESYAIEHVTGRENSVFEDYLELINETN